MKKTYFLLTLSLLSCAAFAQQAYKPSYQQLTEFEGLYQYTHNSKLKIAASPKDTLLFAIINESRYALRPFAKDVFQNASKDKVTFFRNGSNRISGYTLAQDTFKLLNSDVSFPKQMWYPRPDTSHAYQYIQPADLKDGLPAGHIAASGLNASLLNEMMQKIIHGTYPNVHSVLIIKDGKLVFEEYFYDNDRNKLHELRSATKCFISALTGIAIAKGYIKSKHETVLSYFPEYHFQHVTEEKKKITVEHLLTNQSGLDCDISDPKSEGNETVMSNSKDWVQFTLDLPMIDSVGNKGRYCSGNPITLGRIIEKQTKMSLPDFAKQTLFKDLGIRNFVWNFKPDQSSAETFCQVYLTSRDMAKFGQLYLNKGKWNDKQVIAANWVQESLAKHSVVQGLDYGYLWWVKYLEADGVRYYGKAAQGNGGQKIYIWEEQNMVTVITGGNYNVQSPSDELIRKYILPAFNPQKAR